MKTLNVALAILVGGVILLMNVPYTKGAETPKTGGTFVVGLTGDLVTINPITTTEIQTRHVVANIFSKLVYSDQKGDYHGDLAEKWTVSKDNLRITFELRKGAKWHDGNPITAEDVKFSLESLARYHPRGGELKKLSEIIVLNNTTLEIRFSSLHVSFFPFLDETGYVIPKHIYGSGGDLTTHPANSKPIGSGPFIFKEWQKGDHITLIKNKDYFIPGEPYIDKAVYKIIPQAASRVLSLETGEIDYLSAGALPDVDVCRLKENPKFVVTTRGRGPGSLMKIIFNTRRKPWDDLRVRQAVAYAIDRNVIIEKATFGLGLPAYSPFLEESFPWAYNPEVEKMYPRDLAKSAKLLNEAGYPTGPKGIRFTSTIIYDRGVSRLGDTAAILREQLKDVGIELVSRALDKATVDESCFIKYNYDLWIGPTSQGSDPSTGIERFYLTKKTPPAPFTNANDYSNPKVDMLFSLAKNTFDLKERGKYYREAQLILMQDLPTLSLIENPKFAAFPKNVRGVSERRFFGHYYGPSDAWFSQ